MPLWHGAAERRARQRLEGAARRAARGIAAEDDDDDDAEDVAVEQLAKPRRAAAQAAETSISGVEPLVLVRCVRCLKNQGTQGGAEGGWREAKREPALFFVDEKL